MPNRRIVVNKGDQFGRLEILEETEIKIANNGRKYRQFICKCNCGNICIVQFRCLRDKRTISCGCYRYEINKTKSITHGKHNMPEYQVWRSMKKRCLNPNHDSYKNYGERGIKVCERWLNSFENFISDMGERPSPKHSIDRINNNMNYETNNCRWATQTEQLNNTRFNVRIEHNGQNLTLAQWAKILNCDDGLIAARINKQKWDVKKAIETPVRKKQKNKYQH
jgi:hypothetical protein